MPQDNEEIRMRLLVLLGTLHLITDKEGLPWGANDGIPKVYDDVYRALEGDGTDPQKERARYGATRKALGASHAILRQDKVPRSREEIKNILVEHWGGAKP
jgi:hypothetical protein